MRKKNFMKYILLLSTAVFLLFVAFNCKSPTAPLANNTSITLSLADVSCTEAWLSIKAQNVSYPVSLTIKSGSKALLATNLTNTDSVIYIDSLLPNQSYTLQGSFTNTNHLTTTTNSLNIQTLDTTSNNFTWQTFTFGGNAGSCSLYDCTIVNDTLAYAVGEIYLTDSTGQPDPQAYNFAVWNGKIWQLLKVPYVYNGLNLYGSIYSIFALSESDIWFGIGNMIHWDGQKYLPIQMPSSVWGPNRIDKIWGDNNENFYIVGNGGSIAHYQNGQWSKIESGTNNNVTDVWGSTMNKGEIIYCVNHDQYGTNNSEIISIQNNEATITSFNEDEIALSIWIPDKNIIYVGGGSGLFKRTNNNWEKINYKNSGYVGEIRGNASNDFFISGGYGLAAHFNGSRWKVYDEISLNAGNYYSESMKGNVVILVGYNYDSAVIALGRRN